jgi:hypothetical protein
MNDFIIAGVDPVNNELSIDQFKSILLINNIEKIHEENEAFAWVLYDLCQFYKSSTLKRDDVRYISAYLFKKYMHCKVKGNLKFVE